MQKKLQLVRNREGLVLSRAIVPFVFFSKPDGSKQEGAEAPPCQKPVERRVHSHSWHAHIPFEEEEVLAWRRTQPSYPLGQHWDQRHASS